MGRVSVLVNGRNFTITCDDGQEAREEERNRAGPAPEAREQERNRAGPAPEAREQERNRAGPAPEAREQKRNRASPEPEAVHGASKPDEAIAARLIAS